MNDRIPKAAWSGLISAALGDFSASTDDLFAVESHPSTPKAVAGTRFRLIVIEDAENVTLRNVEVIGSRFERPFRDYQQRLVDFRISMRHGLEAGPLAEDIIFK